jgi:hypothetical protein
MVPTPGTNLAKISKLIETERTSGSFSHEDCQFFVSDFFLKYPKLVGSFIRSF